MKKYGALLAVTVLIFASLACQTVLGGGSDIGQVESPQPFEYSGDTPDATAEATEESSDPGFSFGGDSEFPMPEDASNVVSVAGTVNFQTKLSLEEVMAFYRDTYGKQGLTERELLTTVTDGVFSFVFDGDPSGQAIVIQGVDLGDGTVNVNISLQDV
ncbi:MAG: hypothetical protein JNM02_03035 [Anaerolineales bacterium]|nr:hypothetical protein [Anaerolineales bacterium]